MLQETEMREFFERVINDFTGLTVQANKVEELSNRVQTLSEQVSALHTENDNLKREISEAWTYAKQQESKVTELDGALHDAQEHAKALQDTIVASDSRVSNLTKAAEDANAVIASVTNDRDVANSRVKDYEILVSDLQQQLFEVTSDRDHWKQNAEQHSVTIATLTETVGRVQSILNPKEDTNVEQFPQFNVG